MPHNFDDLLTKDRSFVVRGETFGFLDVAPEVLSGFDVSENGTKGEADENAVWKIMDAQIMLFLNESDQKRWKELRSRKEEPVTIAQLTAILTWLMEEQTGRPTEQPSASASGRGRTAPSSGAK
jgi:hypothetical protein